MSSVLDAINRGAKFHPHDIAVTDGQTALSYDALRDEVDAMAAYLAAQFHEKEVIAFCLKNSPAWVVLDLALIKLGHVSVPIPPFFTPYQIAHALKGAGTTVLITDQPADDLPCDGVATFLGTVLHFSLLTNDGVSLPAGTAKITFTSGTTGAPKGVCLSQEGLEQVANRLVEVIGQDFAGTHCAILPLAVLLENVAGLYPTLLAGGCYYIPKPETLGFASSFMPDFGKLVRCLAESDATSCIMVPEILRGTLMALDASGLSLPDMKLVAVGGAAVSSALLARAAEIGLPVYQGYGLSEMGSVVALNTPDSNRMGSIGKVLPGIGLEIAEDGEILISHPAFLGYVGGEAAPAVLYTGDIARRDDDGYLYIDGRKSNILITSFGRNVAPEWVESELLSQPQIGQALVFGDSMPALAALIVPSSAALSNDDIASAINRANQALPEYAQVKHWAKVLPFSPTSGQLTPNGRLRRSVIHENYESIMRRCFEQPGQYIGFFEKLVAATERERAQLHEVPQIRDALQGRISREAYLTYLGEAYHHVKHTVSLMQLTDQKLPPEKAWLSKALHDYIAEEAGHEEWILDDIRNAGGNAAAVRAGMPHISTELMVAYAYDYVTRVNPVGFFGMVFVLEGTSTQLATRGAEALMRSLNLPDSCFRYLLSHGTLDLEHIRFFRDLMDRIDDSDDQQAIIHMARSIFMLFADIFRNIPNVTEDANVAQVS